MSIGERVKSARLMAELSQRELPIASRLPGSQYSYAIAALYGTTALFV